MKGVPGRLVGDLHTTLGIDLPPLHSYLPVRTRVRLSGAGLDRRLAAGEDPFSDADLAARAAELVGPRSRRRIVRGLRRVLDEARPPSAPAVVTCDREGLSIARPALEQLTLALQSRHCVQPQGVAVIQIVLTDPCSPLYAPAYPAALYEVARQALLALRPGRMPFR